MRLFKINLIVLLAAISIEFASAQDVKNANGYVQIFDISSSLEKSDRQQYYFENDILRVTYLFWGERGNMKVSIQNKTDKPIYIDWSKSFYQNNMNKLGYSPENNMTPENEKIYESYLAASPTLSTMDYELNYHSATNTLFDTKAESVTKIDATSTYTRSKYHLIPGEIYKLETSAKHQTERRYDDSTKTTEVYFVEFTAENTPLKFTSFIVYSTDEAFSQEQNLKHDFYVSKIKESDAKHFRGEKVGKTMEGYPIYKFPFRESTGFYFEIDKKSSVIAKVQKK